MIANLQPDEAEALQVRSRELVDQEFSLRALLRSAKGETQAALTAKLGIKQENVSRIEQRADMMLSTLNDYLRALGGRLTLVVEFDGRPQIWLKGFGAVDKKDWAKRTRKNASEKPQSVA